MTVRASCISGECTQHPPNMDMLHNLKKKTIIELLHIPFTTFLFEAT